MSFRRLPAGARTRRADPDQLQHHRGPRPWQARRPHL